MLLWKIWAEGNISYQSECINIHRECANEIRDGEKTVFGITLSYGAQQIVRFFDFSFSAARSIDFAIADTTVLRYDALIMSLLLWPFTFPIFLSSNLVDLFHNRFLTIASYEQLRTSCFFDWAVCALVLTVGSVVYVHTIMFAGRYKDTESNTRYMFAEVYAGDWKSVVVIWAGHSKNADGLTTCCRSLMSMSSTSTSIPIAVLVCSLSRKVFDQKERMMRIRNRHRWTILDLCWSIHLTRGLPTQYNSLLGPKGCLWNEENRYLRTRGNVGSEKMDGDVSRNRTGR